jgi:predicted helicase
LVGEDESNFVRVHDASYIRAARRLYMTATPRLFDQEVKQKAEEHSAVLASMDDEASYGPEFHRLSFGEAVERGLLTDYKVLVLTVDEDVIAGPLQSQVVSQNMEKPRRRHQDRRLLERAGQTRRSSTPRPTSLRTLKCGAR